MIIGDVAQLVEHLPCTHDVSGSTPLISTILDLNILLFSILKNKNNLGAVAQQDRAQDS
jgi:hypothetical protein